MKRSKPNNSIFFLRGNSYYGVSRIEDLINLHSDINCRGDLDLSGFGKHLVDLQNKKGSIILNERNPSILVKNVRKLILDQIKLVCGIGFPVIGSSSKESVKGWFMRNHKYVIAYQKLNQAIIANFSYYIKAFHFNKKLVPGLIIKNETFLNCCMNFGLRDHDLHELEKVLYGDVGLVQLLMLEWWQDLAKNIKLYDVDLDMRSQMLWVDLDNVLNNPDHEISRIWTFLDTKQNQNKLEDCLSNGLGDYNFEYRSAYDVSYFSKQQHLLLALENKAKDYSQS